MGDQRHTEKEPDYRKPTRINRKVKHGDTKKRGAAPRVRGEAYQRERFDTRRAIDLLDDDEI